MKYDKTKFKDCKYIFPTMLRDSPQYPCVIGWIEIGGDPANPQGQQLVSIRADRMKGIFGGYSIMEDPTYPSEYKKIGKTLTLSGARSMVRQRVLDLAEIVSQELGLPIVDFDEARRFKEIADKIAVERIVR